MQLSTKKFWFRIITMLYRFSLLGYRFSLVGCWSKSPDHTVFTQHLFFFFWISLVLVAQFSSSHSQKSIQIHGMFGSFRASIHQRSAFSLDPLGQIVLSSCFARHLSALSSAAPIRTAPSVFSELGWVFISFTRSQVCLLFPDTMFLTGEWRCFYEYVFSQIRKKRHILTV